MRQTGRAIVIAVVVDQQIARRRRHIAADGDGAKQVAALRVAPHIRADAKPQIVQRALAPVTRLHKRAPQLQPLLQKRLHAGRKFKQAVGIEPLHTLLGQHLGGACHAVGACDFQIFGVPQNQVVIARIKAIQITPRAAAFPYGTERQLPQPPHFAQDGGIQPALK